MTEHRHPREIAKEIREQKSDAVREQRRYEIARDVMAACAGYPVTKRVDPITTIDALATAAVQCADALLAALAAAKGATIE